MKRLASPFEFEPSEAEALTAEAARAREGVSSKTQRLRAGTVHTPAWLARFVARAADELLREELGLAAGLSHPQLGIVDPACGPGVFLASALAVAGDRRSKPACVLGLERERAAAQQARQVLERPFLAARWPLVIEQLDTLHALQPQQLAPRAPYWLVLGNPPWVASAQAPPSAWLAELLADFRVDVAGAPLRERKVGVLADAYVRFLRWAAELARQAQQGAVLALVTSGAYLDGPVHRGLRGALRHWFDALHVIDLGGSALLARGTGRDDNVFGVRPNVALLLAARRGGAGKDRARAARSLARVGYRRLTGSLQDKAAALQALPGLRVGELALTPSDSFQRFVPGARARDGYARWPSLAELFPFHREGVQTNRDAVAVDRDRDRLLARLHDFARGRRNDELAPALRAKPHYDPATARRAIARALESDPEGHALLRPLQYRPLDRRWFVTLPPLCHRPRPALLAAMDRSELALISARKDRGSLPWACFGAASAVIDNCYLSTRSSCRARAFPTHDPDGVPNVDPRLLARFVARLGREPSASQLAHYALSWLASPVYRARHDAALKADYPRIPWPDDTAAFEARAALGRELAAELDRPLDSEKARTRALAPAALYIGHHALTADADRPRAARLAALTASIDACG